MKKLKIVLLFLMVLFFAININIYAQNSENSENQSTCIYFFYGQGCPHCAKVEPFIDELEKRPDLEVHRFEIYNNRSNALLLMAYFDAYNVS